MPFVLPRGGGVGPAGPGVAPGGAQAQVLTKKSAADFDTEWLTPASGGGSGVLSGVVYTVAASDAPAALKNRADYVCTGANDQNPINSAFAAGASVLLSMGTFNLSAPIVMSKHGLTLVGTGLGARRSPGTNSNATRLQLVSGFSGAAAVVCSDNEFCLSSVVLKDFLVHGQSVGANVHGIHYRVHDGYIGNVLVQGMSGDGFRVEGYTSPKWDTYDCRFDNLMASSCGGAGFHMAGHGSDIHLMNTILHGNRVGLLSSGGSSFQVTGLHTYENSDYGVHLQGNGTRGKLVNLKCEHSGKHGLFIDGNGGISNVQVSVAGFNCNGKSQENTYHQIALSGPNSPWICQLSNLMFGNSDGVANWPAYALHTDGSVRHLLIMGLSMDAGSGRKGVHINGGAQGVTGYGLINPNNYAIEGLSFV